MKILITGISGQDGALLARNMISKGHEVHGFVRRGSLPKTPRTDYLGVTKKIHWHQVELTEFANVFAKIKEVMPDQIFNLAAQSFVADSFLFPALTMAINYNGYLNILEAVRLLNMDCAIYQASTSEMFGTTEESTLTETTPFDPRSPYAISKVASHQIGINYREAYGMKICNGILFNHESELRGREFVTRKVTLQLNEVKAGLRDCIYLGNLDSVRDWGYAGDYVVAMEQMVNHSEPDDYVVATNEVHSVRDLVRAVAECLNYELKFEGRGIDEVGVDMKSGNPLIKVDPKYYRPTDVTYLRGDFSKIHNKLGWRPTTSFDDMVVKMVEVDKKRALSDVHVF